MFCYFLEIMAAAVQALQMCSVAVAAAAAAVAVTSARRRPGRAWDVRGRAAFSTHAEDERFFFPSSLPAATVPV